MEDGDADANQPLAQDQSSSNSEPVAAAQAPVEEPQVQSPAFVQPPVPELAPAVKELVFNETVVHGVESGHNFLPEPQQQQSEAVPVVKEADVALSFSSEAHHVEEVAAPVEQRTLPPTDESAVCCHPFDGLLTLECF
jgi:hypothetical protein